MKIKYNADGYNNPKTFQSQILCLQTQDIEKTLYGSRSRAFRMENSGNSGLKNNNVMKRN